MYWLGIVTIVLVQGSLLPKTLALYRMRAAGVPMRGEPRLFYYMLVAGLACFEVYSWFIMDWVYIVSNVVGLCNAGTALYFVLAEPRNDVVARVKEWNDGA